MNFRLRFASRAGFRESVTSQESLKKPHTAIPIIAPDGKPPLNFPARNPY